LHDLIQPDGADRVRLGIWHSLFGEVVRPAFERLVAQGRIGGWGVTALGMSAWQAAATGVEAAVIQTFAEDPAPAAAQIEVNALYPPAASPGSGAPAGPAEEIAAAGLHSVGVMGIRPTRGGALTDAFDRKVDPDGPEMAHYRRAAAFRALAAELGMSPATLAHRYALAVPGVACVTLGVKNRIELRECLAAETRGPLEPEAIARVLDLTRGTA
jgi:aryl-alcohol dehydrogenase-like predicted oxidoreductase